MSNCPSCGISGAETRFPADIGAAGDAGPMPGGSERQEGSVRLLWTGGADGAGKGRRAMLRLRPRRRRARGCVIIRSIKIRGKALERISLTFRIVFLHYSRGKDNVSACSYAMQTYEHAYAFGAAFIEIKDTAYAGVLASL